MMNQDYIIITKENYVELRYKGTSLKMHMKTSEDLYIFIGKRQPEHALKYLQLSTTENNSRVSHNNLHKNSFYIPYMHNLPNIPSSIAENGRTSGHKYQRLHQVTTTGVIIISTRKYQVVQKKTLNNRQFLMTGRRSICTVNDNKTYNTAYKGNISALVNQGEISANQGEISAVKNKKVKTMAQKKGY
jgi:hypothetical protein